jgi:hypothetical protein
VRCHPFAVHKTQNNEWVSLLHLRCWR